MLDPGSTLLGLFGGAGGGILIERYRHHNDLRRRGAEVVGPIFAMLVECDPDRLAINAGPHSFDQLKELWERSSQVDAALQTLAIELPAPGSELADQLASAIQRSLSRTNILLNCLPLPNASLRDYDIEKAAAEARAAHDEARAKAEGLRRRIRGLTKLSGLTLKR
jgi:hypothetical protein